MNRSASADFALFNGSGEVRALMRGLDWSSSPLGDPHDWPPALRTVVSLMLDSKFPMFTAWGPELGFLYNDAYAEILGVKHPAALGRRFRDIWGEIWSDISPLIELALAGEAIYTENLPLVVVRKEHEEQTWFTFSYSPVRDDNGVVAGMYCACTETTSQVLAQRRQSFQLEMADALRDLMEPTEAVATACKLIGGHLGVTRVGFGDVDLEAKTFLGSKGWTDGTVVSMVGKPVAIESLGVGLLTDLCAGKTLRVDDITVEARTVQHVAYYSALGMRAMLVIPVLESDRLISILVIGSALPRAWSDDDVAVAEDVLARTRATVQRARAEAALRAERDRSQGILDNMAEGFVLLDHDFRVLQVNRGALRLDTRPASDIIGLSHWEAWPGSEQLQIGHTYKRAMAERIPLSAEQNYIFPDGRSVWLDIKATPANQGLALIYNDITERKKAEQALQQVNETLETRVAVIAAERDRVWRMSQDILAIASLNGYFVSLNPAFTATLGWDEREATTTPFMDLIHAAQRDELLKKLTELALGQPARNFETRALHKDGSYRWLSWMIVQEHDLLYGVGRDITMEKKQALALHQAEDALRQSQKMEAIGQLTGGIAHDFNNLLASMVGNLEMMKMRIGHEHHGDLARYIDSAMTVADRAAALTHRLLAFSRRQTLDPKPTDVNRLVASMSDLIHRTVGPSIRIDTTLVDGLWNIRCDPNQLESSLLNLAINARDAMPDGGQLLIETSNLQLDEAYTAEFPDVTPGDYVAISVIDTGTGMPADVVARAFDPFFTTKPLGQGTGLGLSMVHGFVKQSGGHIRIYSEPGKGTAVRLKLPRYSGVADADVSAAAPGATPPAKAKETVLLVDDESALRSLLAEMLGMQGYATIEADDGPAGLRILESSRQIDLLVTDVGLPGGLNGRQLADAARTLRPQLQVLFITGYAENAAIGDGLLATGMQVMTKPFGMDVFVRKVRGMIDITPGMPGISPQG
ncbi:MAG: sensor hybrid histidine kinase [Herminiimonas sp.]|nr:sensor hybrid histidine kinase [Herminiimonas sp.]